MTGQHKKTIEVARELGVNVSHLLGAIRDNRFPAPARDVSGHFEWTARDRKAARKGIRTDRRRKRQTPALQQATS
jgi:hypothetical protein